MRVENATATRVRTSYLQFTTQGLGGKTATSAKLRLKNINTKERTGTYKVSASSHNDWTETAITANTAPIPQQLMDRISGNIPIGTTLEWEVSKGITQEGLKTFILHADTNAGSTSGVKF